MMVNIFSCTYLPSSLKYLFSDIFSMIWVFSVLNFYFFICDSYQSFVGYVVYKYFLSVKVGSLSFEPVHLVFHRAKVLFFWPMNVHLILKLVQRAFEKLGVFDSASVRWLGYIQS